MLQISKVKVFQTILQKLFDALVSQIAFVKTFLPIYDAGQTASSLYASGNAFTYQDLPPFVLSHDGKTLMILDGDDKT